MKHFGFINRLKIFVIEIRYLSIVVMINFNSIYEFYGRSIKKHDDFHSKTVIYYKYAFYKNTWLMIDEIKYNWTRD